MLIGDVTFYLIDRLLFRVEMIGLIIFLSSRVLPFLLLDLFVNSGDISTNGFVVRSINIGVD